MAFGQISIVLTCGAVLLGWWVLRAPPPQPPQPPRPPRPPGAGGDERRLRVLTHNLWCHYPMSLVKQCAHAMPGRAFEARLRLFAAHCAAERYDVVCVQELFLWRLWPLEGCGNFELLAALLADGGLVHHTDPSQSMRPGRWVGQNAGVAIFSRLPISNCEAIDFERTAEALNTKGFVTADVRLPCAGPAGGRTVRIVSAHMDARDWRTKSAQIAQLAAHLARPASGERGSGNGEGQLLVCGDLNVCPQKAGAGGYDAGEQYACLVSQMGRRGLTDAWAPEESEPTEGGATLDHIFLRSAGWRLVGPKRVVRVEDESGRRISDHYGLALTLEVCSPCS